MKIKFLSLCIFIFISCQEQSSVDSGVDHYNDLQTKLIMAERGSSVLLPKGFIHLNRSLWVDGLTNVVIEGHGIDATVLSFKDQIEGSEGLRIINSKNITLKNFTIEDSKGDLIKVENTSGINFINIKAQWTGKPKKTNGAYGLYPVNCEKVLIDHCVAKGASDAGIYVGQSKYITVRNSEAYYNVAGIEIENSYYADVYNNYAHDNAGGILVFDLPDLVVKSGRSVRVYNNVVVENNYKNFAPVGNVVASVPTGTGIMILATADVEIYQNKIYNNKTANTCVVSYYILEEPITDTEYYPYPSSIHIHDNLYQRKRMLPSLSFKQPIGFLLAMNYFNKIPDIVIDGIVDEKLLGDDKTIKNPQKICIQNNAGASMLNLDAQNDFENMSTDATDYDCSLPHIDHAIYP